MPDLAGKSDATKAAAEAGGIVMGRDLYELLMC